MAKKKEVTNEMLMTMLVSLSERMDNVPTKDDLILAKEEMKDELRPVAQAVDKDAVTLVDHGRRIVRVEKHLSLN